MLDGLEARTNLMVSRTTRHHRVAISNSIKATSQHINKTINNVDLIRTTRMEHLVINMARTISPRTHHSSRWVNFLTTTEEAIPVAINSNRTLTRRKINRNSRSNNAPGKTTNHDPTKASNTPTRR
jgi:hypothetical protein